MSFFIVPCFALRRLTDDRPILEYPAYVAGQLRSQGWTMPLRPVFSHSDQDMRLKAGK
ncbi:MAG: hypothetical protein HYS13_00950 [Planctomycetia bacterium]|nr:hypothetical protein [Planctomycetia bacterium]